MGRGRNKTDIKNLKILGQRLRKFRIEKGLSIQEVGLRTEKDRQSIYRVERGEIDVGYIYLLKLCEGLEITPSELFKDIE